MHHSGNEPKTPEAPGTMVAERGATSVEYALIGALIAAVIVVTVGVLGLDVLALWQEVDW